MARRTLQDLYVRGREVTIGEGEDATPVWVQKMNPVEHAQAIRRADAARAKLLACKFNHESEEYQSVLDEVLMLDGTVLIEILCVNEEARILLAREAQVASEEKWKGQNYLDGLRDSWTDEMIARFTDDPDDLEASRVHEELQRFLDEVRDVVEAEIDAFRISLQTMTERELVDSAMQERIKNAGDGAWVNEYHRSEIAFGTRSALNHREKVFAHRGEVDDLQAEAYIALAIAFREITVDPTEGKGSAVVPPSSSSSDQSAAQETEPSSGPQTATA